MAPVLAALEEALLPLGARPHWGKLFTATPARAAALYPRADDFRTL
ncbi:D-arabinono-1,4-lactone oxidase, partial [Streptacidiphilus cavernicola]